MATERQLKAKKQAIDFFNRNQKMHGFNLTSPAGAGYAHSGVVGVGLGNAASNSDEFINIYVVSNKHALIPPVFNGVRTQTVISGKVCSGNPLSLNNTGVQYRLRPAVPGVSVGHVNVSAGTLGCCVIDENGVYHILSNNHVLANCNIANIGDPILQPGPIDNGSLPNDIIAKLSDFEPLDFNGGINLFDAAIARIYDNGFINLGIPNKFGNPVTAVQGMAVKKYGRTTGLTNGIVEDESASFWIDYGGKSAWLEDQIVFLGVSSGIYFSRPGDSGALIVKDGIDQKFEPVALLCAGSDSGLTIGSPIVPVLSRFGVAIA